MLQWSRDISRAHEIYLLRTRYHLFYCMQEIKVVSRAHEMVSRGHEVLSRAHEIRFFSCMSLRGLRNIWCC